MSVFKIAESDYTLPGLRSLGIQGCAMTQPLTITILLFIAALVFIRPTADIPINDDWQYSHVTKNFAERGEVVLDVPIAPALVGQALLGGVWSRLIGFSHVHLRLLTALVALIFLVLMDRIMVTLNIGRMQRTLALVTLVLNPFFLHFSTSFMTEIYGHTPMLLGILVWLGDSKPLEKISMRRLVAAVIIGSTFWVRQFCVLAFPALIFASYWPERKQLKKFQRALISYGIMFLAPIILFIWWSHYSGNVTQAASEPLKSLVRINTVLLFYQGAILCIYLVAFFLPLIVPHLEFKDIIRRRCLGIALWILAALVYIYVQGFPNVSISQHLHKFFPFSTNIIQPYGIGPITLTDMYYLEIGPPLFLAPWAFVGILLALLTIWTLSSGFLMKSQTPLFARFFACYGFITLYIVVMAFRKQVFDRYYFGIFVMAVLYLATLRPSRQGRTMPSLLTLLCVGLLAVYSVLGTHDYFRWQEVRWSLVGEALARGIRTTDLDGGYEVNGWHSVEKGAGPDDSIADPYFRPHRRYAIVIVPGAGDTVLKEEVPDQMLFQLPALKLVERR